jgi:type I restriction enzyme R subunit
VVDYIGIAAELRNALRNYTDAKGKGQPTLHADEGLKVLLEKLDVIRGMMHGFDYRAFETDALKVLAPAANHILGVEDGQTFALERERAEELPVDAVQYMNFGRLHN